MKSIEKNMWKMKRETLNRQETVDNFCDACITLAARDRRKVERFLERHAYPKIGAESGYRERWTKKEMRACYNELRDISPKVANAWRPSMAYLLEMGLSRYYVRLAFEVLADSLECRTWIENSSDDCL